VSSVITACLMHHLLNCQMSLTIKQDKLQRSFSLINVYELQSLVEKNANVIYHKPLSKMDSTVELISIIHPW